MNFLILDRKIHCFLFSTSCSFPFIEWQFENKLSTILHKPSKEIAKKNAHFKEKLTYF